MVSTLDKNEIAKENLGLVYSLVKKFVGRGIEYEELVSAGNVGLVKAINGFDESRGFKFSTYAVPVILGEIKRLFRDGGTIKVSRSLKELSIKANRMKNHLSATMNADPTLSQLAEALEVDKETLVEALDATRPVISLTMYDDEDSYQKDFAQPEKGIGVDNRIALTNAMEKLSEIEQKIIVLRFYQSKTQTEVAKILEMSQVQVSRKEKKILLLLRQMLEQ
jgi:RNA polymerase sporulation-specific sigma factor